MKIIPTKTLAFLICALSSQIWAQDNQKSNTAKPPRPLVRLLWQDDADLSLKWSDVTRGPNGLTLSPQAVTAFPKLQADQQSFVQMEETNGIIVVGIHDNDNGNFQSGWVALNSGVVEEEHGDHSHWHFENPPTIAATQLGQDQGNPAHVYNYQGDIFLANDKKNGFTILNSAGLNAAGSAKTKSETPTNSFARFYQGGGGHITLAAVDKRVCYATWVDRDGDNLGRVDVVPIHDDAAQPGYQIKLPSGGLHGAIANSGRVFFAPADGICWVDADVKLAQKPESVKINHLSLGEDAATGKPLRTGAFANHGNHVLFTTGAKEAAALCLIDAKASKPEVIKIAMPIEEGLAWTTPACVRTPAGKQYALLFSDRRGSEAAESLAIVDLDPNNDGKLSDAKIAKSIPVGPSKIVGHGGHHEATFSASGRLAFVSNPGDGSIWVISLSNLEVDSKHQVGGVPSRIVAIGG